VRRFLLLFICFLGVTASFGQYSSRLGRFKVDQVKGCAPFTITITNPDVGGTGNCTPGQPCLIDYEGKNTPQTNTFTFTYTTPGTYKLSVLYQSIGADDIMVTVVDNSDPTFQVYTCIGTKVEIKVTDKTYDTYVIDFNNDGTPETVIPNGNNAVAQHDYVTAGTYTIGVRGKNVNAADNCKTLTDTYITATNIPNPSMGNMTAVDANDLSMTFTTAPHILYKLEVAQNNDATFQAYQDVYQSTSISVPSLLLDNTYYCFRLNAVDACTNASHYSNTICSQDFDVDFVNGANQLHWRTATDNVTSVEVQRNGTTYSLIPGAPLNFTDTDYDCNKNYCYEIIVNYGGTSKSSSLTKCGIGILQTTFPAIDNITSIVRVGAELTWAISDPKIDVQTFDVLRSTTGNALALYAQTTASLYTDADYDYNGGTCYQINYNDFCNNRSAPGIIACPMSLTGSIDDKNAITLVWNKYTGYNQGVNTYQVTKYDKTGGKIGVYNTTDTTFLDYDPADNEQTVIYTITAIANEAGVEKSISNNITIEKPVKLILPTAFTPNGDGVNPVFTISGKFVSKMTLQIFDRWGVLVFTSDKNEPWDGTKGGRVMPESAYVWKAEVEDFAGHTFTKEGTVLLLRPPH
jgi:gliding motility-associated-like protein